MLVIVPEAPSERTTASGIVLTAPDTESTIISGEVFDTGVVPLADGTFRDMRVRRGDKVWFPMFKASKIKHEGVTYHVITEDAILAVV